MSVLETRADLLDRWRAEALTPIVAGHTEQARAAVERKIGALREAVAAALRARLAAARRAPAAPGRRRRARSRPDLRRAAARFEQARLALEPARLRARRVRRRDHRPGGAGPRRAPARPRAGRSGRRRRRRGAGRVRDRARRARAAGAGGGRRRGGRRARARRAGGRRDRAAPRRTRTALVRDMPRADLESLRVARPRPTFEALGRAGGGLALAPRARPVGARAACARPCGRTPSVVHAWAEDVLARLRRRFEAQAGLYRLQIERAARTPAVTTPRRSRATWRASTRPGDGSRP